MTPTDERIVSLRVSLSREPLTPAELERFDQDLAALGLDRVIWCAYDALLAASTRDSVAHVVRVHRGNELVGVAHVFVCSRTAHSMWGGRLGRMMDLLPVSVAVWSRQDLAVDLCGSPGFVAGGLSRDELAAAVIAHLRRRFLFVSVHDRADAPRDELTISLPFADSGFVEVDQLDDPEDLVRAHRNLKRQIEGFAAHGGRIEVVEGPLDEAVRARVLGCIRGVERVGIMRTPFQDAYPGMVDRAAILPERRIVHLVARLDDEVVGYHTFALSGRRMLCLSGAFDRTKATTWHAYENLVLESVRVAKRAGVERIHFGPVLNATNARVMTRFERTELRIHTRLRGLRYLISHLSERTSVGDGRLASFTGLAQRADDDGGPPREAASGGTPRDTPPSRVLPWKLARIEWFPRVLGRLIFGQPLAPTREEWERVLAALWRGDPAMDRVVEWMFEGGAHGRKALFEQALARGVDSLTDPPPVLRDFFGEIDKDPEWLNRKLIADGFRATHLAGRAGFYVVRDMALMGGYAYFNSMNQTLAFSGALHKDTALRVGETGKWINDVTEPGGMERFAAGFITTIRVRMIHALVRRHIGKRDDWDAAKWGLPINQADMLATYLAFGPATLLGMRVLGVPLGRKDAAAHMHLWRYIGWLSGVDDAWLARTEGDGLRKLYHILLTHRSPDENARHLGEALRNEPLNRYLPRWESRPRIAQLVRRYTYHKHLSVSSLLIGPIRRKQLGLPMLIFPWYPLLTAPLRFAIASYYKLRGGAAIESFLADNRESQVQLIEQHFRGRPKDIIRPGAAHPAHVG
jgi:hypothetical protein